MLYAYTTIEQAAGRTPLARDKFKFALLDRITNSVSRKRETAVIEIMTASYRESNLLHVRTRILLAIKYERKEEEGKLSWGGDWHLTLFL